MDHSSLYSGGFPVKEGDQEGIALPEASVLLLLLSGAVGKRWGNSVFLGIKWGGEL